MQKFANRPRYEKKSKTQNVGVTCKFSAILLFPVTKRKTDGRFTRTLNSAETKRANEMSDCSFVASTRRIAGNVEMIWYQLFHVNERSF